MNQDQSIEDFTQELNTWLDAPDAPATNDTAAWMQRLGAADHLDHFRGDAALLALLVAHLVEREPARARGVVTSCKL